MSPPRSDEDAAAALADSEAERDGDAIPRADFGPRARLGGCYLCLRRQMNDDDASRSSGARPARPEGRA